MLLEILQTSNAPSLFYTGVLVSAWEISSSHWVETIALDSYTGRVCQSLALGHYGSPSAVIASVLDGVESEGIRLEEVTSFSVFTNGFGKKKKKESLREMYSWHWIGLFWLFRRELAYHRQTNAWPREVEEQKEGEI